MPNQQLEDAFNSMLRADYIPLRDTAKLSLLADYYVDYYGFLGQMLSENDQLIVGRRRTVKTTLLYRTLVECMRSWGDSRSGVAKPRTLAIYVDLNKCQSLSDVETSEFSNFEHVFASELCDAIREEIARSWPAIHAKPGFFAKLFKSAEENRLVDTRVLLAELADVLKAKIPRIVDQSGRVETKEITKTRETSEGSLTAKASKSPSLAAGYKAKSEAALEQEENTGYSITYRLTVADLLRVLGELRETAGMSAIFLLIDEFSALTDDLQRRFTTLLKKLCGNHSGLYIKLCAITDKYTLGSSLILQRDLLGMPGRS